MNETLENDVSIELTRPFRLAAFSDAPVQTIEITASADECAALAARYRLLALDALSAQLTVRLDGAGEVIAEGRLQAEVVQECVVTLEPLRDSIESTFEQRFTTKPDDLADDLVVGPDDLDPPEPIRGETIDLGELVAQFLSLAINPYPRAPEADSLAEHRESDTGVDGPFAALAQLRERMGD